MKKDFLGNVLNIGDEVVFMLLSYRTLSKGTIISMSNQKCKIEYDEPYSSIPNRKKVVSQFYYQVVKVM